MTSQVKSSLVFIKSNLQCSNEIDTTLEPELSLEYDLIRILLLHFIWIDTE